MPRKMKDMHGFTLIEMMVVVVIIGVLSAMVAVNVVGSADDAMVTATKSDMRSIEAALEMYRLDNHHYPSTDQGLAALISKPSGFPEPKNWGPKKYMKKMPVDSWKNEYLYLNPGEHGEFDLVSMGRDGREGGEAYNADLNNWEI